eukprot:2817386-Rhodomonas_salina.1
MTRGCRAGDACFEEIEMTTDYRDPPINADFTKFVKSPYLPTPHLPHTRIPERNPRRVRACCRLYASLARYTRPWLAIRVLGSLCVGGAVKALCLSAS